MRRGSQEDLVLVPDTLFSSLQKLSRIILCAATILLDFAPFSLLKWSVGVYSCMEIQDREKGEEQREELGGEGIGHQTSFYYPGNFVSRDT